MVFVGNHGCLQVHTGPVSNIKRMEGWINVMDHDFNLHLRREGLVETWVVQEPCETGRVHSLEIYDARGGLVVQFFGKRKPGLTELEEWTRLVQEL
jgi:putative hemin transport protein